MSLDVYLRVGEERIEPCEHCGGTGKVNRGREEVFWANVTHNLNTMAEQAGLYQACWRPEEIGAAKAKDLIAPLKLGLQKLLAKPDHFKQWNQKNGWGDYDALVRFVQKYLLACEENPEADLCVSR